MTVAEGFTLLMRGVPSRGTQHVLDRTAPLKNLRDAKGELAQVAPSSPGNPPKLQAVELARQRRCASRDQVRDSGHHAKDLAQCIIYNGVAFHPLK